MKTAPINEARLSAGGPWKRWLLAAGALWALATLPQAQAADTLLVGPQDGPTALQLSLIHI